MTAETHPFTPEQLREHRRLKRANRSLAARVGKTITPRALEGTLAALDLLDDDVQRGPAALVLADCCIHEWQEEGRTLLRAFAESPAVERLTGDERRLLDLWQAARLTLLRVDEVWEGVGMRLHDALEGREVALLSPLLARPLLEGFWLIARVFPLGGYWMTTPSVTFVPPLADSTADNIRAAIDVVRREKPEVLPLVLTKFALTAHSLHAELVEEEGRGEEEGIPESLIEAGLWHGRRLAPRPPSPPGRNEPCPCGSGKKYKKCCALAQRPGA
jgi:hypothetical protein